MQPVGSVNRLASDSALLFWTIIFIASEHHETHSNFYNQLFIPHRELLALLSSSAIQSIEDIHAILLLCLWPIPKQQMTDDPVYNYIGIASTACIRLNLHKPLPPSCIAMPRVSWPFGRENPSIQTQRLTWLACFSISTQYVAHHRTMP